ncbi:MAG: glycosyltransferase [Nanoarchaeota archaeon]|nr:glycosyltransferase [Nanoarchaeota archaeon]
MKVAMFTDTFLPNKDGVVTSICNHVKGLKKRNIDVVIFAPGEKTKLDEYFGARVYYIKGLEFKKYPGYKIVLPTKFISRINAFLEIEEPDIYHIHSPFSLGIAGMLFSSKFKKPIVGTFHTYLEDYIGYLFNGNESREFYATKKILGMTSWNYFRFIFNKCSFVISPTNEIAKVLRKKGFKNIVVVPSAVDFDYLDKQKKINIRKKHKIPKGYKIILYVGRLGFEKKLNVLLDAFKMLNGKNYLLIVGKGPFEKKYKDYVRKNKIKNVKFVGYVKDEELSSYYRSCDLFVSPSDTETQGLTLVEAMHFGKPVIGANRLGVKEVIADYKNGLKFEPNNSLDLKEKIEKLLNDKKLYKKISKNAKECSKKYSIENSTNKLMKVYKKSKYEKLEIKDIKRKLSKRFKSILNFV